MMKVDPRSIDFHLFLDDERRPPIDKYWPYIVCRSFAEFVEAIESIGFLPVYISFDHDLGDGLTGFDCAKWFVNSILKDQYGLPEGFHFYVHSQNPIGKENIEGYLNNFLEVYKNA